MRNKATALRLISPGFLLLLAAAVLTLLGLVTLSSAGKTFASDPLFIFKRQSIWVGIAFIGGLLAYCINLEYLRKGTWWFCGAVLVLLVLVLIPGIGVSVNGARRWLDLGIMRLQVSDLAKLAIVFCLAHYFASQQRDVDTFLKGFLVPCMLIGLSCGLIILQPDFGTAFLCGMVGFGMLFLAGSRLLYMLPTALGGVALFSLMVYLDPVRMRRITAFMDIEGNKADSAYQLWQGILAFGAGGVKGVGLGNGRQQLSFLPEAHTDFIFPIIGEELGLICTALVVLLFLLIFISGTLHMRKAPNLYQFLLVMGALLFITLQALINMGVATGLLPTKGMSLPFISYGGSNLLIMFIMIGLILNCFREWNRPVLREPREL